MNLFLSLGDIESVPWSGAAVAVGTFDGVHRGHQEVIGRAIQAAKDTNAASVVLTFDRHPAEVVRPDAAPPYLTTLNQRLRLIASIGPDNLMVVPFTRDFSSMTGEAFAAGVLRDRLKCLHLFVGEDFRFGRDRSYDVRALQNGASQYGFDVSPVSAVQHSGSRVSSTTIRAAVQNGVLAQAEALLGRRYVFAGTVVEGRKLGRELGYRTANLASASRQAVPGNGIYAVWVKLRQNTFMGACSIGVRPTVGGTARTVEVHLPNYHGPEFYGASLEMEFVCRVRDEEHFADISRLTKQIGRDVETIRHILGENLPQ